MQWTLNCLFIIATLTNVEASPTNKKPTTDVVYFNTSSSLIDLMELLKGRDGCDGRDRRDGKDGKDRQVGIKGEKGEQGVAGPPGLTGSSAGGVVYTRWGRTICPDTPGTELVYEGIVAKGYYSGYGGGIDYQCLPNDPDYLEFLSGVQTTRAYVAGVEYEQWDWTNGPYRGVHLHVAVCAICHTSTKGSSLMIPGKTRCPKGWTQEYYGYLMAEWYLNKGASTFACVDKDPEFLNGSGSQTNGAIFMNVESKCDTFLCPPYEDGKELTCVVCTK